MRGRISTGRTPTGFEFLPISIAPPWPVGSERPVENAPGMAEHEGGNRAETAAPPRKTANAGPYLDGGASNRVRVFADLDSTLVAGWQRKAGRKSLRDGRGRGGEPSRNRCTATKIRQGGAVSRRGGLPQGSSFCRCREHPRGRSAAKGRSKRPPGWPSTRGVTEAKPLHRHENPPRRGRISTLG
jgi:hypothetical protein